MLPVKGEEVTVWYNTETLIVLADNLGVPATADRIWLRLYFPTLASYL